MVKVLGEEVFGLVEEIKPLLAHREPLVQSAVLAELLGMWLAGFQILGEAEATGRVRGELLAKHCELVRELTVVNAQMLWGGEMTKDEIADGEDWGERFAEMLAVMDVEQLMRIRHRLGKRGWERTVKILSLEIAEREKGHGGDEDT